MIVEQRAGTKMKNILIILLILFISSSWNNSNYNSYPVFYDRSGQITSRQVKIWADTVSPTTANGYIVDISSAGFTSIKSVSVVPQMNTSSMGSIPVISVKLVSTTTVVVNILTQNSGSTTILGISVLSGDPLQFASSMSGIVLHVKVEGI